MSDTGGKSDLKLQTAHENYFEFGEFRGVILN
jgi:hypothetical protein